MKTACVCTHGGTAGDSAAAVEELPLVRHDGRVPHALYLPACKQVKTKLRFLSEQA